MPDMYALYVCIMAGALVRGVLCSARRRDKRGVLCSARRRDWLPFLHTLPAAARPLLTGTSHAPRGSGAPALVPAQPRPPASSCGQCVRTGCGGPGRGVWRGGCARLSAWAARGPALRDLTCAPACWCMPYMYALFVCLVCIPDMHALYVQAIPERIDHAGGVKGHSRTSPG